MRKDVYKVEVVIVDHDQIGPDQIKTALEETRYPNRCIYPRVLGMRSREVDWTDEHPLNMRDTMKDAAEDLFREKKSGSLWVRALSELIGKKVIIQKRGVLPVHPPREYTLLDVDDRTLHVSGMWPIAWDGRPTDDAKEFKLVINREDVISVAEAV